MNKEIEKRIGDAAETLLQFYESNTTFQGNKIVKIPARVYTDNREAEDEVKLIFKRLPLMLALSCELPDPGDYKAMEVVGLPILITRDKVGTVRAFLNVCAHRWVPVAPDGHGKSQGLRFVCPFHGWTYGIDGKLIGITDNKKFGDIDKCDHGLRELPCEERHGMIFVGLTPENSLNLDSYYGALLEEFADFQLHNWVFLGTSELRGANWKIVLTNFFESYHFAAQHPNTVALRWQPDLSHYEAFGPNMRLGFSERSIQKLRDIPREDWGRREGEGFTFMRNFFPNVVGSIYPSDISVFIQVFPDSTPESSRVVVLYLRREQPEDAAEAEKLAQELRAIMKTSDDVLRDEDFATGIASQKALTSGAFDGLTLGLNERGPQYFHEWVDWYLKDDQSIPKPAL